MSRYDKVPRQVSFAPDVNDNDADDDKCCRQRPRLRETKYYRQHEEVGRRRLIILLISLIIISIFIGLTCKMLLSSCSACQRESAYLRGNMDQSVDPCHDFFAYACGNWNKSHPLLASESQSSIFSVVDKIVDRRMKEIFEEEIGTSQEPAPIVFIRKLVKGFSDRKALEAAGLAPLTRLTDAILQADSWRSAWTTAYRRAALAPLANVHVDRDRFNRSTFRLHLDRPSFAVSRHDMTNSTDVRSRAIKGAYTDLVHAYVEEVLKIDGNSRRIAQDIVDFETKLAAATAPLELRHDVVKMAKKMSLATLQEETGFDWLSLVNELFQSLDLHKVTADEEVMTMDLEYLKSLAGVLATADGKLVKQFIAVRVCLMLGDMTTDHMRQLELALSKEMYGVTEDEPLDKKVMFRLMSEASELVGRLYVDRFFTLEDKDAVTEMIKIILKQYRHSLESAEWMLPETKLEAFKKIDHMKVNVGYPQWIKDDKKLADKFPFDHNHTDALDMYLELTRVTQRYSMKRLSSFRHHGRGSGEEDEEWSLSAADTNANYDEGSNSINFPAAILQSTFYDRSRPSVLNYAILGAVIGHETGHAFDDYGSKCDHIGNQRNWWDPETQQRYNNKSQCFIHQFNSISVPEANGMHLKGEQTLGENIADSGAVRQLYHVIHSLGLKDTLLNLSPDQLFFLSYSNLWCGSYRQESLRNAILTGSHSPLKYRVNVPLANSRAFAGAFSCPKGSPMNPLHKCALL